MGFGSSIRRLTLLDTGSLDKIGSEPLDLDPVAQIRRCPFSRDVFVKESLGLFENNLQSSAV
jgi:hypothetical protein